ncbi:MAG: hypothetical protein LBQ79_04635, partial [Deltaproteobacteria bacterium]|nr:hypothetical protein [Deltaproteobacteria bacterium]
QFLGGLLREKMLWFGQKGDTISHAKLNATRSTPLSWYSNYPELSAGNYVFGGNSCLPCRTCQDSASEPRGHEWHARQGSSDEPGHGREEEEKVHGEHGVEGIPDKPCPGRQRRYDYGKVVDILNTFGRKPPDVTA